jgi:CheY-like chemotaxis protein
VTGSAPPNRLREGTALAMRGLLEGLRVVLVDDDPDARDLLTTVLSQRSAQVFAAESASEAFLLVKRERPDVLISDIAMPEEDGYMLVRRVRMLPAEQGGRTPSIAVTAYAGRADHNRALEAGFDAHYPKPIDIDALVARLLDIHAAVAVETDKPGPY